MRLGTEVSKLFKSGLTGIKNSSLDSPILGNWIFISWVAVILTVKLKFRYRLATPIDISIENAELFTFSNWNIYVFFYGENTNAALIGRDDNNKVASLQARQ